MLAKKLVASTYLRYMLIAAGALLLIVWRTSDVLVFSLMAGSVEGER